VIGEWEDANSLGEVCCRDEVILGILHAFPRSYPSILSLPNPIEEYEALVGSERQTKFDLDLIVHSPLTEEYLTMDQSQNRQ